MKKFSCVILTVCMVFCLMSLAGCGDTKALKLGLGIHSYIDNVQNAKGDSNGSGEAVTTAATVMLDAKGKIIKCAIDSLAKKIPFTSDGKFVEIGEVKTKYEQGNAYGLKSYSDIDKEWYSQADAFVSVVSGKTIDEVKRLQAQGDKGNDEVIKAGCTIAVSDFIVAIEKAVNNAVDCDAKREDTLTLGIVSTGYDAGNATEDENGTNGISTTVAATAVNGNDEIVFTRVDAVETIVEFDKNGEVKSGDADMIPTKRDFGPDHGSSQNLKGRSTGGEIIEWFRQADVFADACKGKTADGVLALVDENGYGVEVLRQAGCIMNVGDIVKATVKSVKTNRKE